MQPTFGMRYRTAPVAALCALVPVLALGACTDDDAEAMADRVEAQLRAHPDVDDRDIEVRADGTVVVLRGEVDNLLAHQAALTTARTAAGDATVVDEMQLAADERGDDVIERRVAQALMVDPGTDLTVDVEVVDGYARLRGFVDGPRQIAQARRITASVPGVRGVIDELRARPLAAR